MCVCVWPDCNLTKSHAQHVKKCHPSGSAHPWNAGPFPCLKSAAFAHTQTHTHPHKHTHAHSKTLCRYSVECVDFSGGWWRALIRREASLVGITSPPPTDPPTFNVFPEIKGALDPAARCLFMYLLFFASIPGITWLGDPFEQLRRTVPEWQTLVMSCRFPLRSSYMENCRRRKRRRRKKCLSLESCS